MNLRMAFCFVSLAAALCTLTVPAQQPLTAEQVVAQMRSTAGFKEGDLSPLRFATGGQALG